MVIRFTITRRLTLISRHFSKAARQEDYSNIEPIEIKGSDEISDLVFSFNALSQKLKENYASLDQQVKDRTKELERKNHLLKLEILERSRAEEALRESEMRYRLLAGGVAHDLNNVLSGIVSYPELILLDLPEDSELIKPIKTIETSGKRAAAIVQDLLTVAEAWPRPRSR